MSTIELRHVCGRDVDRTQRHVTILRNRETFDGENTIILDSVPFAFLHEGCAARMVSAGATDGPGA